MDEPLFGNEQRLLNCKRWAMVLLSVACYHGIVGLLVCCFRGAFFMAR